MRKLREVEELEPWETESYQFSRDCQLQFSRRVDWRFLLPDPQLHRVAYLGDNEGSLLIALQHFSESLTVISSSVQRSQAEESRSLFDLVVLRSRSQEDVEIASSLLRDKGYLYWEIDRTKFFNFFGEITKKAFSKNNLPNSRPKKFWRLRHVRDYRVRLEQLGFCDIEVHWHRPNFKTCLEIIPLNDQATLDYVFSQARGSLLGKLKLATGRSLLRIGLVSRVVPHLSVVARKNLKKQ
ncbi:MAG: hypothetical protein ACE5NG_15860 [bacterium]